MTESCIRPGFRVRESERERVTERAVLRQGLELELERERERDREGCIRTGFRVRE